MFMPLPSTVDSKSLFKKSNRFSFLWLPGCCFLRVQSYSLCFVTASKVLKIFLTFLLMITLPWLFLQYCEYSAVVLSKGPTLAQFKGIMIPYILPNAGEFIVLALFFSPVLPHDVL